MSMLDHLLYEIGSNARKDRGHELLIVPALGCLQLGHVLPYLRVLFGKCNYRFYGDFFWRLVLRRAYKLNYERLS